MSGLARMLRAAFGMLTIVPMGLRNADLDEADLAAARLAFPVVGLAIGLGVAGLSELMINAPPLLAAFVLVAVEAVVTGGLHLDGVADTADGLFLPGDAERRLAAMRDPHVGSLGAIAIALVLLGKLAALASLPGPGHVRSLALVAAAAISRSLILVAAGMSRYARSEGTGRVVVDATTSEEAFAAGAGIILAGLVLARWPGLAASLLAVALAWGVSRLATHRLGGITGDILGSLVEVGELVILVTLGLLQSMRAG